MENPDSYCHRSSVYLWLSWDSLASFVIKMSHWLLTTLDNKYPCIKEGAASFPQNPISTPTHFFSEHHEFCTHLNVKDTANSTHCHTSQDFTSILQYNKHIEFKVFWKEQNRVDDFVAQYFLHYRENYPMCKVLSVGVHRLSF